MRAEVVFDGLVIRAADAGLCDSHFGKLLLVRHARLIHGRSNLVNLLLGEGFEYVRGFSGFGCQLIDLLIGTEHDRSPLCLDNLACRVPPYRLRRDPINIGRFSMLFLLPSFSPV